MDPVTAHAFTFLTLLAGIIMMASGIVFRHFPPKRRTWYNSIQVKPAWQNNEAIWREAMRLTARPALVLGLFFTGMAFMPLVFPAVPIFTFTSATTLIFVSCIAAALIRQRQLNRLLDEDGNIQNNA